MIVLVEQILKAILESTVDSKCHICIKSIKIILVELILKAITVDNKINITSVDSSKMNYIWYICRIISCTRLLWEVRNNLQ